MEGRLLVEEFSQQFPKEKDIQKATRITVCGDS
jgi:hypothetical protein